MTYRVAVYQQGPGSIFLPFFKTIERKVAARDWLRQRIFPHSLIIDNKAYYRGSGRHLPEETSVYLLEDFTNRPIGREEVARLQRALASINIPVAGFEEIQVRDAGIPIRLPSGYEVLQKLFDDERQRFTFRVGEGAA